MEKKESAKLEKTKDTQVPERASKSNRVAEQNVTRVPWLSGAFNYRKEMNSEQNWALQAGVKGKVTNPKFLGLVVFKIDLCFFQLVKNKIKKYFE